MKLVKRKISELGQIVGGGTPDTSNNEYYENGNIPWITPKDLSEINHRFISRGSKFITEEGLKKSSAKILPKNSIIFSSRAPIGYIAIATRELCTNQGFKNIISNDRVYYIYLYYLLKFNKKYIETFGVGTTFKEISASILGSIKLFLHESIEDQKAIAFMLNKLDEKIELNNKINDNLVNP